MAPCYSTVNKESLAKANEVFVVFNRFTTFLLAMYQQLQMECTGTVWYVCSISQNSVIYIVYSPVMAVSSKCQSHVQCRRAAFSLGDFYFFSQYRPHYLRTLPEFRSPPPLTLRAARLQPHLYLVFITFSKVWLVREVEGRGWGVAPDAHANILAIAFPCSTVTAVG